MKTHRVRQEKVGVPPVHEDDTTTREKVLDRAKACVCGKGFGT